MVVKNIDVLTVGSVIVDNVPNEKFRPTFVVLFGKQSKEVSFRAVYYVQ